MTLLPKARPIESLVQLQQYVDKHDGSVMGQLSFIRWETSGGGLEYDDYGKYIKNENSDGIQFHPFNPEELEIDGPISVDEAFIAADGVAILVNSRHSLEVSAEQT
jgi:hypothetical protein